MKHHCHKVLQVLFFQKEIPTKVVFCLGSAAYHVDFDNLQNCIARKFTIYSHCILW